MISLIQSPPPWTKKKKTKPKKRILPNALNLGVYEDTRADRIRINNEIKRQNRRQVINDYKDRTFRVLPKPEDVFDSYNPKKEKKVKRSYIYLQPFYKSNPKQLIYSEFSNPRTAEKMLFGRKKTKVIRSKKPPKGRRNYQKSSLQKLFEKLK